MPFSKQCQGRLVHGFIVVVLALLFGLVLSLAGPV